MIFYCFINNYVFFLKIENYKKLSSMKNNCMKDDCKSNEINIEKTNEGKNESYTNQNYINEATQLGLDKAKEVTVQNNCQEKIAMATATTKDVNRHHEKSKTNNNGQKRKIEVTQVDINIQNVCSSNNIEKFSNLNQITSNIKKQCSIKLPCSQNVMLSKSKKNRSSICKRKCTKSYNNDSRHSKADFSKFNEINECVPNFHPEEFIENISSDIENETNDIITETLTNEDRFKEFESQEVQIMSKCDEIINNIPIERDKRELPVMTKICSPNNTIARAFNETLNINDIESIIENNKNIEANNQNNASLNKNMPEDEYVHSNIHMKNVASIPMTEHLSSAVNISLTYKDIVTKILQNSKKHSFSNRMINYKFDIMHKESMQDKNFVTKKGALPEINFKRVSWSVECDADSDFGKPHKCFKSSNSFAHPVCIHDKCQNGSLILNFSSTLKTAHLQIELNGHEAHCVILGLHENYWHDVCYLVYSLGNYCYINNGKLRREHNLLQTQLLDLLIKTTPKFNNLMLLYQKIKGDKQVNLKSIDAFESIDINIENNLSNAKCGLARKTAQFFKEAARLHCQIQYFKQRIIELSSHIGLLEADVLCIPDSSHEICLNMIENIKAKKFLLADYRNKYAELKKYENNLRHN